MKKSVTSFCLAAVAACVVTTSSSAEVLEKPFTIHGKNADATVETIEGGETVRGYFTMKPSGKVVDFRLQKDLTELTYDKSARKSARKSVKVYFEKMNPNTLKKTFIEDGKRGEQSLIDQKTGRTTCRPFNINPTKEMRFTGKTITRFDSRGHDGKNNREHAAEYSSLYDKATRQGVALGKNGEAAALLPNAYAQLNAQ